MEWINYHHLLYFWVVAKEGGIVKASKELRLAHPTISGQIHRFEEVLGRKLFVRKGRRLVMTDFGLMVFRYAEEIFSVGAELQDALQGRPSNRPPKVTVGIADVFPRLIAFRLLEPALTKIGAISLTCREDKPERLLTELAIHNLDVVLTDAPMSPLIRVKAYSHLLGECDVTLFAVPALAEKYKHDFPQSLDGAPMLLPTESTTLRRSLDDWFHTRDIHPLITGEFEDSIMLKVFGQAGHGIFPVPTAIAEEVTRQYGVLPLGRLADVKVRFYAISVEKQLRHPVVLMITEEARKRVFRKVGTA